MSDPIEAIKEMIRVTKKGGLVTFTMDVAPYSLAIKGENNVNTGNFHAFQEVLLTNTEFFSPPKFQIPSNLLSWQNDCKTSSGLRDLISSQLRKFKGLPVSPNFYVFGGAYTKR